MMPIVGYMIDGSLDDILAVKGFGNIYFFDDILVVAKVKETWPNIWPEAKKVTATKSKPIGVLIGQFFYLSFILKASGQVPGYFLHRYSSGQYLSPSQNIR